MARRGEEAAGRGERRGEAGEAGRTAPASWPSREQAHSPKSPRPDEPSSLRRHLRLQTRLRRFNRGGYVELRAFATPEPEPRLTNGRAGSDGSSSQTSEPERPSLVASSRSWADRPPRKMPRQLTHPRRFPRSASTADGSSSLVERRRMFALRCAGRPNTWVLGVSAKRIRKNRSGWSFGGTGKSSASALKVVRARVVENYPTPGQVPEKGPRRSRQCSGGRLRDSEHWLTMLGPLLDPCSTLARWPGNS